MPPIGNIKYFGIKDYMSLVAKMLKEKLYHLFWETETKSAEISFGFIAIGWWIVLWASPAFDVRNLYDYLSSIASQSSWAWFMLALGTAQIALSTTDQKTNRFLRATVWTFSCAVWSYVALVSMMAVPVTTAAAAYSVLSIGSFWAFMRSLER